MADLGPPNPQGWWASIATLGGAMLSALIGRFAWHTSQVRKGCRRFWSIELLWELPLAVFMGLLGGGAAQFLGLDFLPGCALASFCGWLGPRGVEAALLKLAELRGWK